MRKRRNITPRTSREIPTWCPLTFAPKVEQLTAGCGHQEPVLPIPVIIKYRNCRKTPRPALRKPFHLSAEHINEMYFFSRGNYSLVLAIPEQVNFPNRWRCHRIHLKAPDCRTIACARHHCRRFPHQIHHLVRSVVSNRSQSTGILFPRAGLRDRIGPRICSERRSRIRGIVPPNNSIAFCVDSPLFSPLFPPSKISIDLRFAPLLNLAIWKTDVLPHQ